MEKITQRYRYSAILLKQLVKTDFKLRYQGSVLGYLWSLLRPLALFIILYIVFAKFLRIGDAVPHFPVYLLLGIVLWNFFGEVTSGGVGAIVGKGDILRKINFPKYVVVLSGSFSALINLCLNFIIIGAFMVVTGVDVQLSAVLMPLLILELFVCSLAVAFLLSAAFVRFRDVSYIWEVVLQGAFYATPILYPMTLIPEKAAKILILSPPAQIIQDIRYVLVTPETITITQLYGSPWMRIVPVMLIVLTSIFAISYFRSRSKYFAEEI